MKDYLKQFITESQVKYASIFTYPIDVMEHLLFSTGNGYSVVNGNLYTNEDDAISFEQQYTQTDHFIELIQKYKHSKEFRKHVKFLTGIKENSNSFFKKHVKQYPHVAVKILPDDEIYNIALQEALTDIDNIVVVDQAESTNVEYWYEQLFHSKYLPLIHVASGYCIIEKLNELTEPSLVSTALAILHAYLKFYETLTVETVDHFKHPFAIRAKCSEDFDNLKLTIDSDLKVIKREIARLTSLA